MKQWIVQFLVSTGKALSDEREQSYRVQAPTWQEAEKTAQPYLQQFGTWVVLDVVEA